ncbi:MAG: hypothetical protein AAF560_10555 [Acidobacteriota bacterium]
MRRLGITSLTGMPWQLWLRRLSHPSRIAARSAGYNLVVLAVAVTVLNILVAQALPLWSYVVQKQKEEELIFRGLQYAEAIRVFQTRQGRLPTKLEELIKVEPRSIRKLYKNPMSDDGSWDLIFQDSVDPRRGQNLGGNPSNNRNRDRNNRDQEEEQNSSFGLPQDGETVRVGPIIGVRSKEGGEAIKVFAPLGGGGGGASDFSQWKFTVDLVQGLGQRGVGAADGNVQIPTINSDQIGRPWPPGISLPRFQGPGRNQRGGSGPDGRNEGGVRSNRSSS